MKRVRIIIALKDVPDGERITLCEMPDFKGLPGIVYRRYQA